MKRRIGSSKIKEKLHFDYLTAKIQWKTVKLASTLVGFMFVMTAVAVYTLLYISNFWGLFIEGLIVLAGSVWGAWKISQIVQDTIEESRIPKGAKND